MNSANVTAFLAEKSRIDAILGKLAAMSDDHFDASPNEIGADRINRLIAVRRILEAALTAAL